MSFFSISDCLSLCFVPSHRFLRLSSQSSSDVTKCFFPNITSCIYGTSMSISSLYSNRKVSYIIPEIEYLFVLSYVKPRWEFHPGLCTCNLCYLFICKKSTVFITISHPLISLLFCGLRRISLLQRS